MINVIINEDINVNVSVTDESVSVKIRCWKDERFQSWRTNIAKITIIVIKYQ